MRLYGKADLEALDYSIRHLDKLAQLRRSYYQGHEEASPDHEATVSVA
jgi:hypothetical protein